MTEDLRSLSQRFDAALFDAYRRAKIEADYNATIFLGMLTTRGGRDTAKFLINAAKPSDGYTALYERGRLDLTVEAIVLENVQWQRLFEPEELDRARSRLRQYNYVPRDNR